MCGASLFYILIAILVFPLYCVEFYVFTEMELSNSVVNVSILEVVNRSNPATCWRSCHRNPLCSAYFESELRNECRLVSSNASEQQIEGGAGWKYVVKSLKQPSCPTDLGYIFDQGSNLCFKLLTETRLPKQNATGLCASIGGRIMRIKSEKHQAAVVAYLEKFYPGKNVLIDGSRTDPSSSDWTYSNGEPMTYFKWAAGHPDNLRTLIKLDKNLNLNWSTASSQPKLFLCEVPLDGM